MTTHVRYGARPPEKQSDPEIDATKAPIATEAITVTYLTDPDAVAAVLPKPLQPAPEPVVRVSLQRVAIEGLPPFGSAVFSVAARHGDVEGDYPLFMPQSIEASVLSGRDTFGEPKKTADIRLERTGSTVFSQVSRLDHALITVEGEVTEQLEPPPDQVDVEFYFKFLRAPDGNGLTDPHLVYGSYRRHYEVFERIEGRIELGESPFDPVADLAVEQLRSITWGRRRTIQTGKIVERVPAEWLLPYVHQRYDDLALLLSPVGT